MGPAGGTAVGKQRSGSPSTSSARRWKDALGTGTEPVLYSTRSRTPTRTLRRSWPTRPTSSKRNTRCARSSTTRARSALPVLDGLTEVDTDQVPELVEHGGRGGIGPAGQDRAGEVVERVPDTLCVRARVGTGGPFGRREQTVQERVALLEVGVVPLEAGPVVVAHEREADGARVGDLQQVAD